MFGREKGGKTVFMKLDDLFLCSWQNVFVSSRKMKLLGNAHKYMVECMVEYIFLYLFFIFMLDLHLSPVRKRMVLISHKMFSSPLLQCPLMSGMVHLPSGIFYHSITKISAFLRYLEMMMILSFYHQDAPYLTVFQMMMVKRLSLDLDNRFAAQNILSISKLLLWVESTFRKLRER